MAQMQRKLLGNVRGNDGSAATIQFVNPVTLPPGSQATCENIGTNTAAVLRFGIPSGATGPSGAAIRGERGEQGLPGLDGAPGEAATIEVHGTTLVDDESDVKVLNIGTSKNASLEFYIQRPPEQIIVDEEFISDSTNTVQSKVIQSALAEKADVSSIPTKISDLQNDRSFISDSTVENMIEDALHDAVLTANPTDSALSDVSTNPVQNKVISEALGQKIEMEVEDLLDDTDTKIGERLIFENDNKSISLNLMGEEVIQANILTHVTKNREPVIVASLPTTGEETKLYLVPNGNNNYSMHLWMNVNGTMQYAGVESGSTPDLSGYASKADAIKNITRNGTTFTATRADGTTFTFTQQDDNNTYTIASLMGSSAKGSATQPIYWNGSSFQNTTYQLTGGGLQLSTDTFTASAKPIQAGGTESYSVNIAKSGYTAIGVVGVQVAGLGSGVSIMSFNIAGGGTTAQAIIMNGSSNTANMYVIFYILYKSN